jgi:signal transduction histidine kinase
MQDTSSATQLLTTMSLLMIVGLPIITWAAVIGRMDRAAKLWFAGLAASAGAAIAVAVLHRYSFVTPCLTVMALLLLFESMRVERRLSGLTPTTAGSILALYLAVQATIDLAGLRLSLGTLLTAAANVLFESLVLREVVLLGRERRSRGLLLVGFALSSVIVLNLARIAEVATQGSTTEIFALTSISNAVILTFTFGTVLLTIGHLVFVIEKAHQQQMIDHDAAARAEESRVAAAAYARDLQELVSQRDSMIMLNSRVAAVNSLAIFNSAIVHEISQPAQALLSMLDGLSLKAKRDGLAITSEIEQAGMLVERMSITLGSLRRLIVAREPSRERVDLDAMLTDLIPIFRSEAERRGITVTRHGPSAPSNSVVLANKVLLERIVLNLLGNAFEALSASVPGAAPIAFGSVRSDQQQPDKRPAAVTVNVFADLDTEVAGIRIEDNGPGFDDQMLQSELSAFKTSKLDGVGLGLALARIILETWRGEIRITNRAPNDGGGASVEIRLPLATRAPSSASF